MALLQRMDAKKFPKQAELLWDKDADRQSIDQMIAMAKAMASNVEG